MTSKTIVVGSLSLSAVLLLFLFYIIPLVGCGYYRDVPVEASNDSGGVLDSADHVIDPPDSVSHQIVLLGDNLVSKISDARKSTALWITFDDATNQQFLEAFPNATVIYFEAVHRR